jgi:hypothetical protein
MGAVMIRVMCWLGKILLLSFIAGAIGYLATTGVPVQRGMGVLFFFSGIVLLISFSLVEAFRSHMLKTSFQVNYLQPLQKIIFSSPLGEVELLKNINVILEKNGEGVLTVSAIDGGKLLVRLNNFFLYEITVEVVERGTYQVSCKPLNRFVLFGCFHSTYLLDFIDKRVSC